VSKSRFPWHIFLGLLSGLALGLVYAWVISPVEYIDTTPDSLQNDFKDQFRVAIARAYLATGELPRAEVRLSLLKDDDPVEALSAQAQRVLASGGDAETVRSLALLAAALQDKQALPVEPTGTAASEPEASQPATSTALTSASVWTATPVPSATNTRRPTRTPAPSATLTPAHTLTPRPTLTVTPTVGAPFLVYDQREACDPSLPDGLLRITVLNASGKPVPGAGLIISWLGNEETFYTGFKPELGDGYADYVMQPEITYSLRMTVPSASAENLRAPACRTPDGTPYLGSLEITFRQP
jgi:hypothetical protein